MQLWDDYKPDMIYFDDTVLPMYGVADALGLNLVAHFYNSSIQQHGHNEAVVNGKGLNETQRKALTYDIERGKASSILPQPWQTDTCLGNWHYDEEVYINHKYKTAAVVVPMLNVPVKGDGTIDEDEHKIVEDIGAWTKINGEAIYATRPWQKYGEGPATENGEEGRFGGQKDTHSKPFTAEDIRFTQTKDHKTLYAFVLAWPQSGHVVIKSFAGQTTPKAVRLLGVSGKLEAKMTPDGLAVTLPKEKPCDYAWALKLEI